jgi:hypothetical protein
MGLQVKQIQGTIYSIRVQVLDDVEVGPYDELLDYVAKPGLYKTAVQVHHIVNGEHLEGTGWEYRSAPCVVLARITHEQYHGRFNETLPEHHSRSAAGRISREDALGLYYAMFVEETGWRELWTIAARILTGSVRVPSPTTFFPP